MWPGGDVASGTNSGAFPPHTQSGPATEAFSGHDASGAVHLDGSACPTRPELPPPLPPTGANDWSAIDHLSCIDCFLSPFKQLDEVPDAFTEAWALAMVDVHELFYSAPDGTTRTRALKWNLALHHMLLRAPIRGGRRGHNEIPKRFKAWADGNAAQLVRWWEADRAVVARSRRSTAAAGDTAALQQALSLISRGQLSRAQRRSESQGLGNLADESIVEQLVAKHPARKETLAPPMTLDESAQLSPLEVHLETKYRQLPRPAGTGPSGFRKEYLIPLSFAFEDARA